MYRRFENSSFSTATPFKKCVLNLLSNFTPSRFSEILHFQGSTKLELIWTSFFCKRKSLLGVWTPPSIVSKTKFHLLFQRKDSQSWKILKSKFIEFLSPLLSLWSGLEMIDDADWDNAEKNLRWQSSFFSPKNLLENVKIIEN